MYNLGHRLQLDLIHSLTPSGRYLTSSSRQYKNNIQTVTTMSFLFYVMLKFDKFGVHFKVFK